MGSNGATDWVERFLDDLSVIRSANTVRAYRQDLARWVAFCAARGVDPLRVTPRDVVAFIGHERQRPIPRRGAATRDGEEPQTVTARTVVRRLSAIRQWYHFLALEPERTGVTRNPVAAGTALRTAAGVATGRPALLRYDRAQPQVLDEAAIARFEAHLTATRYRDRAIVALLKDGGFRIHEVLGLRLGDIRWSTRLIRVRPTKTGRERTVPVTREGLAALGAYVRLERPRTLPHDVVFVNLGRRGFGRPFRYRAWVAVCEKARTLAGTPEVHAHAFRHTCATNLAEAGMPLDALRRQLGHAHLQTTMLYDGVRPERVRREFDEATAVLEADRRLRAQDGCGREGAAP